MNKQQYTDIYDNLKCSPEFRNKMEKLLSEEPSDSEFTARPEETVKIIHSKSRKTPAAIAACAVFALCVTIGMYFSFNTKDDNSIILTDTSVTTVSVPETTVTQHFSKNTLTETSVSSTAGTETVKETQSIYQTSSAITALSYEATVTSSVNTVTSAHNSETSDSSVTETKVSETKISETKVTKEKVSETSNSTVETTVSETSNSTAETTVSEKQESVTPVKTAELHRTEIGKLIFFSNDHILIVSEREDDDFETGQILDLGNNGNHIINVVKELPDTEEEHTRLYKLRGDSFTYCPTSRYLIEGETFTTEFSSNNREPIQKDFSLNLRYIFNFDDMSIYDYKTNERLGEMENFISIPEGIIDDDGYVGYISDTPFRSCRCGSPDCLAYYYGKHYTVRDGYLAFFKTDNVHFSKHFSSDSKEKN